MNRHQTPKVSVIIPVFNAEEYIHDIIQCVLSQTYDNWELIIVNDGSVDSSGEILDNFARNDKRITVLHQKNAGVSSARNIGIEHAAGKYVMFFDADDKVESTMLEKMVTVMLPESLVVCGVSVSGGSQIPTFDMIAGNINIRKRVLRLLLRNGLMYSPWNKIYDISVIREYDIKFECGVGYGEDLIFNLAYLSRINSMHAIREPLYIYNYSNLGSSYTTGRQMKYRTRMCGALDDFRCNDFSGYVISYCIKSKWVASVIKLNVKGLLK